MAGNSHSEEHHIISLATYQKIFSILIGLTVVTVAASRIDFGALNTVIAFAIATVKASLVLGYFMHLKYDNKMNRVIIGSGVFFLILLWIFCVLDILTRIGQHSVL